MAVDDSAAHPAVGNAGRVDRLAGDQGCAIVDPRPLGGGAPREADGERVGALAGGEAEPIFVADARHFRRPKIGDRAAPRGPAGLVAAFGKTKPRGSQCSRSPEWSSGKA